MELVLSLVSQSVECMPFQCVDFYDTSLIHNEQNETSSQNYKIVWNEISFDNIKNTDFK